MRPDESSVRLAGVSPGEGVARPGAALISTGSSGPAAARVKPRLRGVSHLVGFVVALGAGTWLAATAPGGRATMAAIVYSLCLAALLGISALYHVPHWTPGPRAFLRRLDHAGIFLLIAGTYTPVCLLTPGVEGGPTMLAWVWVAAVAGTLIELFWMRKPRWIVASLCVALGWAMVAEWGAVSAGLGPTGIALMLGGGVMYTLGAVAYALKRPDPFPTVFGYHEIFHALVVAAACLHFLLVARLVHGA